MLQMRQVPTARMNLMREEALLLPYFVSLIGPSLFLYNIWCMYIGISDLDLIRTSAQREGCKFRVQL